MMTYEEIIAARLTGDAETDARLKEVAQLCYRSGRDEGRRIERHETTLDHLRCVVRSGIGLEQAMQLFGMPKKERNTYRKIFQNYARQKQRGRGKGESARNSGHRPEGGQSAGSEMPSSTKINK